RTSAAEAHDGDPGDCQLWGKGVDTGSAGRGVPILEWRRFILVPEADRKRPRLNRRINSLRFVFEYFDVLLHLNVVVRIALPVRRLGREGEIGFDAWCERLSGIADDDLKRVPLKIARPLADKAND